jgi:hypothetical protein
MPRYHFNVYDSIVATDEEGIVLVNLEAAKREAVRSARALAAEQVIQGRLNLDHRIEVVEARTVVWSVSFRDAIIFEGRVI